MHLLSSSKKFSNKIERWKGGRGNYVRANETRLTVSFTPQLRAKKRKLNSLTAQSPYISRTEAVLRCHSFKRSSPPLPLFYLSIQINFPISTGKIEPNFLIVSRRIVSMPMTWNTRQKCFLSLQGFSSLSRNVCYFLINIIFPCSFRIYQHFRLDGTSVRFFFRASLTIELEEKYRSNNYPCILMENIFYPGDRGIIGHRSGRHWRLIQVPRGRNDPSHVLLVEISEGEEEKIVPVPDYNALRYRSKKRKKK